MITDTPQTLVIGLLVVTLLGGVIGYIIATLRETKRSDALLKNMRSEVMRARADADTQLADLSIERADFQSSIDLANERTMLAVKKEESLELHAQFLSQRIQALESQVSAYEEQQIRLQRDFASYKSNKTRELELAKIKPESWAQSGNLPVLNKRIPHDESVMSRSFPGLRARDADTSVAGAVPKRSTEKTNNKLSLPLSEELDIPSLSESELPDSVEDLEFELADFDMSGEKPRG